MSSWSSPREGAYRGSSPSAPSPPTPLSPSIFPQWIRSKRPRTGLLSNGRRKMACIALCFVLLGYTATSTLGADDRGAFDLETDPYDVVLSDPNDFGIDPDARPQTKAVVAGAPQRPDWQGVKPEHPSVSAALADLHHAVTSKLQSWNPYRGPVPSNTTTTTPTLAGEQIHDGLPEPERLGARTRIGKCTILFNGNSYWERAIRTHEAHDRLHGYRLHVLRQKLLDDVWDKPAYILSLLLRELSKPESERLEWLFWVDADTVILNPHVPVEVFLPPPGEEFADVHLVYSADWNGLNNGVFPIRVTRWSVELLSAVVAYRYFRPEEPLLFRDQTAMWTLMREPRFAGNVVEAPQRWFNAYQGEHNETLAPFQIRRGDLLVHFAGVPERERRMGYWLDRAERHLEDWEVPLKSTSHLSEAREFWEERRAERARRREAVAEGRARAKEVVRGVDEGLDGYGERLTEEQRGAIRGARDRLDRLLGDDGWAEDLARLGQAVGEVEREAEVLEAVKGEAHKAWLGAAHEAIFAGEKDLLEGAFGAGSEVPEAVRVRGTVQALKELVMTPQEQWKRKEITDATNAVTEARGALRSRLDREAAEKQSKIDKAKMMSEVGKQIQAEAQANGGGVGEEGEGPAMDGGGGGPATPRRVVRGGLRMHRRRRRRRRTRRWRRWWDTWSRSRRSRSWCGRLRRCRRGRVVRLAGDGGCGGVGGSLVSGRR